MQNLFNPENPGMRFLSRIFDLIVLNAVFMLSCIPIITIGPALSALYRITIQMVRQEDAYIVKGYLKAFKENFKQSFLLWIPILLAMIFFGTDLFIVLFVIDQAYNLLQIPIWIILFIIYSIIAYAFPLISNYECKTSQALKNAILLSLANIPTTIFFVVFPLGIVYMAAKSSAILVFLFSIILFCGLALLAFINSLFLNRIFERCMQDDQASESSEDTSNESEMNVDASEKSESADTANENNKSAENNNKESIEASDIDAAKNQE